ncbi:MAG TPA: GPW/gp25 family protein [Acetobacteraceae bacterium]|nr:GPW/gp25 family protein [Acetobacteraceae bacterium]
MDVAFPYGFDGTGHTASPADQNAHIRDLIEQVLLTAPGERVNRPSFGSGTGQLVFAPNSSALAMAQQKLIQAGLQQWLSDLIQVQAVNVSADDATLNVTVQYIVLLTGQPQSAQFALGGGGG